MAWELAFLRMYPAASKRYRAGAGGHSGGMSQRKLLGLSPAYECCQGLHARGGAPGQGGPGRAMCAHRTGAHIYVCAVCWGGWCIYACMCGGGGWGAGGYIRGWCVYVDAGMRAGGGRVCLHACMWGDERTAVRTMALCINVSYCFTVCNI